MPLDQDPDEGSYTPYDPVTVRPLIDAPPEGEDSPTVSDAHGGPDASRTDLPVFDERHRDDFQGLLFLGALQKKFRWLGHTFLIRTLTTDELLMVGQIIKEYEGTVSATKAYTTSIVAMCTTSVDGEHLPFPYKEGPDLDFALDRFKYVARNWYPFTIDAIYNEYLALEEKVREVLDAMGEASGQSV